MSDFDQLIIPVPNFNLVYKKNLHPLVDFLYSILKPFHYKDNNGDNLILDLYVDHTFAPVSGPSAMVPTAYISNWCGFIFDPKSIFDRIQNDFISSLKFCKGLFVFSEYAKNIVEYNLVEYNNLNMIGKQIKVHRFYFPVSKSLLKYTLRNFHRQSTIELFGPPITHDITFKLEINSICNSHQKELTKFIINPVLRSRSNPIINTVNNVVFCNVDSASDSDSVVVILNQCIDGAIPIIINKRPIVTELLGYKYPLYYSGEREVILTKTKIKKAHKYLVNLNKKKLGNKFQISNFIATLNTVVSQS